MTAPQQAPWFVPLVENHERPFALFALPQAGAGCATFADFALGLGDSIATYGLNLPGRQARFCEPARTDLPELLEDLVGGLRDTVRGPYALMGYCSGSTMAFLLARALRAAGFPSPSALIALSFPAPQYTTTEQDFHLLPGEEFWSRVVASGGFPEQLAREPDFQEIFEPALRSDYALMAGFRYSEEPRLDVPVTVVAGRHDDAIEPLDLLGWAAQTTATCSLHIVDCDHWLLDGAAGEVARIVENACRTATP